MSITLGWYSVRGMFRKTYTLEIRSVDENPNVSQGPDILLYLEPLQVVERIRVYPPLVVSSLSSEPVSSGSRKVQ